MEVERGEAPGSGGAAAAEAAEEPGQRASSSVEGEASGALAASLEQHWGPSDRREASETNGVGQPGNEHGAGSRTSAEATSSRIEGEPDAATGRDTTAVGLEEAAVAGKMAQQSSAPGVPFSSLVEQPSLDAERGGGAAENSASPSSEEEQLVREKAEPTPQPGSSPEVPTAAEAQPGASDRRQAFAFRSHYTFMIRNSDSDHMI